MIFDMIVGAQSDVVFRTMFGHILEIFVINVWLAMLFSMTIHFFFLLEEGLY